MDNQEIIIPPAALNSLGAFVAALLKPMIAAEVARALPRKTIFTVKETCERLGISDETLRRYELDGLIERCSKGRGVRYSAEEIELCDLRIAGKAALIAVPRKPRSKRARLKENVAAA